jgi:putative ABC transport system substrate-binding protein
MAAAERPDIILMDLEMPRVDGWEATQRLKGNPQTRDIPVIALSAHARMKRRQFITLLGGAAVAWPLAARTQQRERMRRIGVLTPFAADDTEGHGRLTAFAQGLQQLGWTVGQNLRIDYRWGDGKADTMRKYAVELVALAPDVILSDSSAATAPLLQATHTIPIVFGVVADPVGAGYVESLARPGGNATGFTPFEYSIAGKWLELLKEIAPRVTRAAVLRDSAIAAGPGFFGAIQSTASSLGVALRPVDVRDAAEIDRSITAFAQGSNAGLIVTGSPAAAAKRDLIVALAARHRLPAVYNNRLYSDLGGLICYGTDFLDQFRRAAGYVDRILKGEKAADLPVQAPTKYELVINLKTAKALGLTVPDSLLARANEVIE